jgi:hypothetical protein
MIPDCIGSETECLDIISGAGDSTNHLNEADNLLDEFIKLLIGSITDPIE